jgi:hypothetical protein
MNCTPLALKLAKKLETCWGNDGMEAQAAAELRRLHEAHEWQYTMAGERLRRIEKLEAENEVLRQTIGEALRWCPSGSHAQYLLKTAIAKAGKRNEHPTITGAEAG